MILRGWKSIAKHLDCGVRTAQRWERIGLPVVHLNGPRSPVTADSYLLDRWMLGQRHFFAPGVNPIVDEARRVRQELRDNPTRGLTRDIRQEARGWREG